MLFIEYYISSIDSNQINSFEDDLLNILFKHMVELGIFDVDSEEIYRIQFIALSYTMYITTIINIKKHLEQITPDSIKEFMVNLPDYASSLDLGENYFPGLFNKKSIISRTTALDMLRDITKNKEFYTIGYEKAINSLENLISSSRHYSYRSAYIGILSHTILEDFFIKILIDMRYDTKYESLINLPYSLHRADLLIQNGRNLDELLLDIPDGIESIVVDFTLSSKNKYIIDKLFRNYQSTNRMLFIVLYSENRNEEVYKLNQVIEKIDFNNNKNVRIITLEEFSNILNLKHKDKQDLLNNIKIFYQAIKNDKALEVLEQLNVNCLKSLDTLNMS